MGKFFEKVRHGGVDGPRKRAFTLESWKRAFDKYSPSDEVDQALYVSGKHIYAKLNAIRAALSELSLAQLSTETRVTALVAGANHQFETLELKMLEAAHADRGSSSTDSHVRDLARLQIKAADGQSYNAESTLATMLDGIGIPLSVSLSGPLKVAADTFSEVEWRDIALEMNLGAVYSQAESIWEDCVWNTYVLDGVQDSMFSMPTDLDAKRGACAASARRLVLGIEATSYAVKAVQCGLGHGTSTRIKQVRAVLNEGEQQRIEIGPDDLDVLSQAMLLALRDMACPPYLESLISEPQAQLGGLSLSQLFDGWMVVSQATRRLWEQTSAARGAVATEANGVSDMRKYIPFLTREALATAMAEAAGIPHAGALALVDFLTFSGKGKQQLWTQPLVSVGSSSRLYPVMGAVASPPNARFMLELWMAQLKIQFADKGEPFERYLRIQIVEAIAASPLLSGVAKVVPGDLIFKCADGLFAQIDALFCVGSQVFVVEAKCILEPTEATSIGTHRQTISEGAKQAKTRIALIESHRDEFIISMRRLGWNLPKDFAVYPLVAVSTVAHVGIACDGVPVVDDLVLQRFFAGAYEYVGLEGADLSVVKRILHPFYSTAGEAETTAATYFARPPQLQQYLNALRLRTTPMYAVSEVDWHGLILDLE